MNSTAILIYANMIYFYLGPIMDENTAVFHETPRFQSYFSQNIWHYLTVMSSINKHGFEFTETSVIDV